MLSQMLSRNRYVEVRPEVRPAGQSGRSIEDAPVLETIMALNRFYRGSSSLGPESQAIRLTLVGTSLMESASEEFQRSGLLLADHTDSMCELLQGDVGQHDSVHVDSVVEDETSTAFISEKYDLKRKTKKTSHRATKKGRRRTEKRV